MWRNKLLIIQMQLAKRKIRLLSHDRDCGIAAIMSSTPEYLYSNQFRSLTFKIKTMKRTTINSLRAIAPLLIGIMMVIFTSCSSNPGSNGAYSKEMQTKIDSMQNVLKNIDEGNAVLEKNLTTFDTLDYTVFSNQEWVRLHESHSKDI